LCEWCEARGLYTLATIAHHLVPHRGDPVLFWSGELVSLCKECHDSDAQAIEKGGQPKQTIGVDGWPVIFDLKKKKKKQI
jgi:hypothetical protein